MADRRPDKNATSADGSAWRAVTPDGFRFSLDWLLLTARTWPIAMQQDQQAAALSQAIFQTIRRPLVYPFMSDNVALSGMFPSSAKRTEVVLMSWLDWPEIASLVEARPMKSVDRALAQSLGSALHVVKGLPFFADRDQPAQLC